MRSTRHRREADATEQPRLVRADGFAEDNSTVWICTVGLRQVRSRATVFGDPARLVG